MSCCFTSKETRSIVTDIICSLFDREDKEQVFKKVTEYNILSLHNRYNDPLDLYDDEIGEYIRLNESCEQEINTLGSYLYDTSEYSNEILDELREFYKFHREQIPDNVRKTLYWEIADKYNETIQKEEPKKTSKEVWKEKGYDKLSITEIAKRIRKDLKTKYGKDIKFSVRSKKGYPAKLSIEIKEIKKDLILSLKECLEKIGDSYTKEHTIKQYEERRAYTIVPSAIFEEVKNITDEYNYNNSDIMYDYFEINFYTNISEFNKVKII